MADERIEIDVRGALRDIALLKGGLADLRGQMGQTRQSGQQAFGGIGASAIKEARDIDTLKKKYAEVKAAADQLREALKTAYDPRIVSTYTKALGQAEAGLKKIENGAHTAGISLKGASKQGNELGGALKSVFLGSFAAGGLIAALELVRQGIQAGIEQALEFEQGLADLSALTGIKGADLDGLEQIVKKLQNINVQGKTIVTLGPEIERALALVGGAQPELLKDADALGKITEQAIILQKTSKGLSLEDAVKGITTSMGQFNLVAADGSRIINAYAAASKVGSVEIPRLSRELADVGQTANLTGIDLEETLATIELLGKAKIPEGRIGVQLRNIFTILADAKQLPKDAQQAFEKFGVNTDILSDKTQKFEVRLKELQKINGNIPALSAIFGQQNIGGAAVLSTQADVLTNELIPGIRGTSEALDQAAIRIDTNSQKLTNFKNLVLNTLSDAFVDFGNDIGTVVGWLGDLGSGFEAVEAKIDKAKAPFVAFFNFIESKLDKFVKDPLSNLLGLGPNLNPGKDNRTSLDPFADTKGTSRADIEKKIKEAQDKSLKSQIELNAARVEAGRIEDKNEKSSETAANKAKARQREREAELREIEAYNKRLAELQLQKLDPKSEAFAVAKENLRFADQLAEFKKFKLDTEEIEALHQKALLDIRKEFEDKKVKAAADALKRLEEIYAEGLRSENERIDAIRDLRERAINEAKQEVEIQERLANAELNSQEAALLKAAETETDRLAIQQEFGQKRLELARYFTKEIEAAQNAATFKIDVDTLKTQREKALADADFLKAQGEEYINILRERGEKEKDIALVQARFDGATKEARLLAEIAFQEGLLKITDAGDTIQVDAITAKIAALKQAIAGIDFNPKANKDKRKTSFLEDLGLGDEDIKNLNRAKDSIISALQDIAAARIEEADRAIEAAQKKVEAAQLAYDKEKELDATGYADSFKTAEKNLADAKANEEKALQLKREAQKKQLNLDAAMQASSLITAAANTFKGFSSIPLVGQILAVVSIAAMFAAFASAQAKARAAIKFREGGPVKGPTHERGGVPIEAEGGEFVTSRKATAQHFNLLEAVNKNDQATMDRWALGRVAKLDRVAVGQAIGEGKGTTTVIVHSKEDRKAHDLLRAIRDKRQPPVTTTEGKYSVTRYNGRTVRKRI